MGDWQSTRRRYLQAAGAGVVSLAGVGTAEAAGGDEQWAFETGSSGESSPTVVDGTVFVGSWDDNLYAVDATTGEQEWAFQTDGVVFSSPTVVDDTVYVGSVDSNLYAMDAATGEEEWAFQTDGAVYSSPTVVDGIVYVGSNDTNLYAVDAATGEEEWAFQTGHYVGSSPTVVEGTVYVGSDDSNLYAVDTATGEQQWAFQTGHDVYSSPTVVEGTVYVGSDDSNLYAVDTATGEEEWAFQTGNGVHSSPTVVDGTVYVGSIDNNLYAVDAATGKQEWAFETGDEMNSSPTVVDGTVFVGSRDGNLYAVDAATGEKEWVFETGSFAVSSPTVVDGTVFVGSANGNLYAVDAGVSGASEGSRVMLGTLGHHSDWNYRGQSIDVIDPPTASMDIAPATPQPDEPVTFDASGSSDPDGSISSCEWTIDDTTETGQTVTRTFSNPGEYTVELTVTDSDGATDTATETLLVAGGNTISDPEGDDYGPGTYTYPTADQLPKGCFDVLKTNINDTGDNWEFTNYMGAVPNSFSGLDRSQGFSVQVFQLYIRDPNAPNDAPTTSEGRVGVVSTFDPGYHYRVHIEAGQFIVEDAQGNVLAENIPASGDTENDTITFSVPKEPFETQDISELQATMLVFSQDNWGEGGIRQDIHAEAGKWSFGGAKEGAIENAPRVIDLVGPETVVDQEDALSYDANSPPEIPLYSVEELITGGAGVDAQAAPGPTLFGTMEGTLDASDSSDPKGQSLSFQWEQVGTPSAELSKADSTQPTVTVPDVEEETTLTFGVTVTSEDGRTATATTTVTVLPQSANDAPIADAGADKSVEPGETISLQGTDSEDPNGGTLSYQWSQTSGPDVELTGSNSSGPAFTAPDVDEDTRLTFELTVDDGQGKTATDTTNVVVRGRDSGTTTTAAPLSQSGGDGGNPLTIPTTIPDNSDSEQSPPWLPIGLGGLAGTTGLAAWMLRSNDDDSDPDTGPDQPPTPSVEPTDSPDDGADTPTTPAAAGGTPSEALTPEAVRDELETLNGRLNDVDDHIESGEFDAASDTLDTVRSEFTDLRSRAEDHDIDGFADDFDELAAAHDDRRSEIVTKRHQQRVQDLIHTANDRRQQAEQAIDDAETPPSPEAINTAIEAYRDATDTYQKSYQQAQRHDLGVAALASERLTETTAALNREQARRDAVEQYTDIQQRLDAATTAIEEDQFDDAGESIETARDELRQLETVIDEHEFDGLSDAVASLRTTADDLDDELRAARVSTQVQSHRDEGDDYRKRAADRVDSAETPPTPATLDDAIEDYRAAVGAYDQALAAAHEQGHDTTDIEQRKTAVETALQREQHRRDAIRAVESAEQSLSVASDTLDSGDFDAADEHLTAARQSIDQAEATVGEHDFAGVRSEVKSLREEVEHVATTLEQRRTDAQMQTFVDTGDDYRQQAEETVPAGVQRPDTATIESAIEAFESARDAYEDAIELAEEGGADTDAIVDKRDAVVNALDRERARQSVVDDIGAVETELDRLEATLSDGNVAAVDQQLGSIRGEIADLDADVDEWDFAGLAGTVQSLQKRFADLEGTVDTEQARAEMREAIETARQHRERADKQFDPGTVHSLETIETIESEYNAAAQAYETARDIGTTDGIDTAEVKTALDTVSDRLEILAQQRRLQERYRQLDEQSTEAIAAIDADAGRDELEVTKATLETVTQSLAELTAAAAESEYDAFVQRVTDRRAECQREIKEIERRLDRMHVPSTIPAGPVLDVEYTAVEKGAIAGRGGDADVYKATLNRETIAIKEPRFSGTLHTEVVDRFLDEAEVWDQLDGHEHIVDVIDWGSDPLPWIALEYMDGGTLADRMENVDFPEGLWIASGIVRGVRHAHKHGITHLDLKPENVLFRTTEDGLWDVPKVSDWGLAKLLLEHSKSLDGLTPQYAAPEQVDPDTYGSTEQRTDIYQLGAVLYELFTGEPVFEGQPAQIVHDITHSEIVPPTEVDSDLPKELDTILLRALETEKADRYEDILYLRDALDGLDENR